jgi:hypothetical protein
MTGYIPIKNALVAVLQTVGSVAVVYGKEEAAPTSFPAACVSAKDYVSNYESLGSHGLNKRIYQHYIRLYFRIDEKNDADYEDVLESTADDVLAALESNTNLNLGGTCDYSIPMSGQWLDGVKETPVRCFEIVNAATVLVSR